MFYHHQRNNIYHPFHEAPPPFQQTDLERQAPLDNHTYKQFNNPSRPSDSNISAAAAAGDIGDESEFNSDTNDCIMGSDLSGGIRGGKRKQCSL